MTLLDLVSEMSSRLERAGIPHMITGSVASTYYGEPRGTQHIDVVIDPTQAALDTFVASFDRELFYVGDAVGALQRRDQFNIIDVRSGWKVDLLIRRDREFSRVELGRRQKVRLGPSDLHLATAEDVILSKLEWAREGGSDRQLRDVHAIVRALGDRLDRAYLERWAEELDVADDLHEILHNA